LRDEPGRNNTPPQWAALVAQLAEQPQRLAKLQELFHSRAWQFVELQQRFKGVRFQFPPLFPQTPLPELLPLDQTSHVPAKPAVPKLAGKQWVPIAFERRRGELLALTITEAGRELAKESQTAPDCRKPLSAGYCTNELRKLGVWKPQPTHSPKQRNSR
jgi:hypothetical protein